MPLRCSIGDPSKNHPKSMFQVSGIHCKLEGLAWISDRALPFSKSAGGFCCSVGHHELHVCIGPFEKSIVGERYSGIGMGEYNQHLKPLYCL